MFFLSIDVVNIFMKSFKQFYTEKKNAQKMYIDVWHGTKKPFKLPFKESKQGSVNDEGFSGKGFYFFGNESDTELAVRDGYKRKFRIKLDNAYNLDKDDPFSEDTDDYIKLRDDETLRLLESGYDGSYRTLNNRLDEICVFSYKSKRFDGNNKIKTIKGYDWEKI